MFPAQEITTHSRRKQSHVRASAVNVRSNRKQCQGAAPFSKGGNAIPPSELARMGDLRS